LGEGGWGSRGSSLSEKTWQVLSWRESIGLLRIAQYLMNQAPAETCQVCQRCQTRQGFEWDGVRDCPLSEWWSAEGLVRCGGESSRGCFGV